MIIYYLSIVIVISTPIAGGILLFDKLMLKKRRREGAKLPPLVAFADYIFPVVLFITVLRGFILESFVIPSGSMQPTLYAGDMIFANKWSFGFRWPILNTRIFSEAGDGVTRGDIAVFRYPVDPKIHYIKRIVALPGDTIDYKNKRLVINDQAVEFNSSTIPAEIPPTDLIFVEKLPDNDATHFIQTKPQLTMPDLGHGLKQAFPFTVPADHYFVMGDNRDNSEDSRFWGVVPDDHLVAKANIIWMNYKCLLMQGDCDHIGTVLK